MDDIAGWIAPIATTIAAMMTAANLGARVTGWGFVVFTIGSLGWVAVAVGSGQTNLLATNGFLTLVNLVGIWRWLGRQAKYEDGSEKAAAKSAASKQPTLVPIGKIAGARVEDERGDKIGDAVEAMLECGSGKLNYVVVSVTGGIGEQLRAVPFSDLTIGDDAIISRLDRDALCALPEIGRDDWPKALA